MTGRNNEAGQKVTRLRPVRPCPVCKLPSAQTTHPFCSVRCANVDLNRWLSGAYAIPGEAVEEQQGAEQEDHDDD